MECEVLVVFCTFPDETVARQIGALLVERQVAACVSVIGGVRSIYRWEGRICDEAEVLAVIKTTRPVYPRLEAALIELHPYEVPEVLALPVEAGSAAYLGWVAAGVAGPG